MTNKDLNLLLLEKFGELEQICNQSYNAMHGVSVYIEKMDNSNYIDRTEVPNWDYFFKKLKDIRHKRNRLSHGDVAFTDTCAEMDDLNFIIDFKKRILTKTDPLSIIGKITQEKKTQTTKPEVKYQTEERKEPSYTTVQLNQKTTRENPKKTVSEQKQEKTEQKQEKKRSPERKRPKPVRNYVPKKSASEDKAKQNDSVSEKASLNEGKSTSSNPHFKKPSSKQISPAEQKAPKKKAEKKKTTKKKSSTKKAKRKNRKQIKEDILYAFLFFSLIAVIIVTVIIFISKTR